MWDLADSGYFSVYFFIKICDGRALVIDDFTSLYWPEEQELPKKLIPIDRTTIPTTTLKPTTELPTTTTTERKITPGWRVTVSLVVVLGIISIMRRERRIS